MLSKI